jgi:predicted anti-sigma-YlaC factor YlaD
MSPNKHCTDMINSLSDYIDGGLSPELCQSLEDHLKDCKDCRVVIDTLKKTIEMYKTGSDTETIPPKVKERLFAKLNLEDLKN